jgi:hypothetical protein
VKLEEGVAVAEEMSAVEQLELVKHMQTYWADNSVSVTVYYKEDELPAIKKWLLENYNDSLKTVSFLLHQKHGFDQAPYEEISEQQYEKNMQQFIGFPFQQKMEDYKPHTMEGAECASGHCPVR